ncbi:MAG: phosphatidate cytidylyltransferase [Flavobacteriales bacterium]|nr:phosphatidate cytidylyltransferase [Flavobacteriales bacterium]
MEKELVQRAGFGFIFMVVMISAIWIGQVAYYSLLAIIMLFGLYEFSRMAVSDNLEKFGIMYPISISVFLYGISDFLNLNSEVLKLIIILLVFIVFILELKKQKPNPYKNLGNLYLAVIYISFPITLATKIPIYNNEYHPEIIFSIFILIWANDSFAYLVGKNFGKHKLIERISPKKTIEGFVGGLLLTYVVGTVIAYYFDIFTFGQWFIITNIVGIFGVLGDLVESMFKRKITIKDSGKFMPGHGGFLDRFDSFLFTAPFIYIFTQLVQL